MQRLYERQTIARSIRFDGVGLHTGKPTWVNVAPTMPGSGIVFIRADMPESSPLLAQWDMTDSLTLCTQLRGADFGVSTIEHLMAALASVGIDDAAIHISGPEVPIMDGSALPFVKGLRRVGRKASGVPLRSLRVLKTVEVRDGDRYARIVPYGGRIFDFTVDFSHPFIGRSSVRCDLDSPHFERSVSPARTFALEKDIAGLRSMGLALGGSLDNAVVVGDCGVMNPEGLRFSDEFARHKALDAVGDLYLAGSPILGRYVGHKAGHALNNALLRALMAARDAWTMTTTSSSEYAQVATAA